MFVPEPGLPFANLFLWREGSGGFQETNTVTWKHRTEGIDLIKSVGSTTSRKGLPPGISELWSVYRKPPKHEAGASEGLLNGSLKQ